MIPIYQVDAFTDRLYAGNPAAVCPLGDWLSDATMQAIAAENNLAETAFLVKLNDNSYRLRWFTPAVEVDLCGHATLASAHIVMNELAPTTREVHFDTRSGELIVTRTGDLYAMDFPARPPEHCDVHAGLLAALGVEPELILAARDYMVVYRTEEEVRSLEPDLNGLKDIDRFAVIVTAPGSGGVDFVSRFFAPAKGVPEDPVTGSAHCTLVPYWSRRLGKKRLFAKQVSKRGGELWCEDRGARVTLGGRAVTFFKGQICG